ncbi:MAG TPA: enolase C-terminal domain-like protein [Solirubrobacteraceae bacterium]|jgi:muconate cycloisomerase|nr:enolase C-terminal domain-like protein [Solirubrobacteraceae bacterium]
MSTEAGALNAARTARIASIETIPIALPARRELLWRGLGVGLGRWVVVRVRTDDGTIGLGEATPLPDWGGDGARHAGETPVTVCHVIDELLAPKVVGTSPFDIEAVLRLMDETVRGNVYAKAAVEMALFDIQGKLTGLPLHRLLGGAYRPSVRIAHMIGIMSEGEALGEAEGALADGCRAFQVKGTGEPDRDVSLVAALREMTGPDVWIRLDANQGYRGQGRHHAIRAVARLAEAGADMVEQPTEGMRAMAEVREAASIPIIADETCWSPADALEVATSRAADALSVYVAKAGGISRAATVARIAELYGLPCDVNGSIESAIGTAASLHLALAKPAISLPAVIPVPAPAGAEPTTVAGRYYADDLAASPFPYRDGHLFAPEAPGLGVEIDEEKLAAYTVELRR